MSKLTIGEKIVNLVIGAAYAVLMFGVSTGVFLIIFDESEYKVGSCITKDSPPWIKPEATMLIVGNHKDDYLLREVNLLGVSEDTYTVHNTISDEFQVTYVNDDNIESQKVFNKIKIVDCPKQATR